MVDYRRNVSFEVDPTVVSTARHAAGNGQTDTTLLDSNGSFIATTSSDPMSTNPNWRSNYRGDYQDQPALCLTTLDLICWAFQVARGMAYLAGRKVTFSLH